MDSFIRTFRDNTPDAVRKRLLPRPNLATSDKRRAVVKQVIEFTKMFYPDRRGGTGELHGFVDALRSPHPAWEQNIEGIAIGLAHSMSIARGYRDDEKEYIDVLRFHLGLGRRPEDLSQKVEAGLPELVKLAETVKPGLMEGGNAHDDMLLLYVRKIHRKAAAAGQLGDSLVAQALNLWSASTELERTMIVVACRRWTPPYPNPVRSWVAGHPEAPYHPGHVFQPLERSQRADHRVSPRVYRSKV